jgi:transposase-like protein
MGLRNEEVAQVLGIGAKTLYRWVNENDEFRQSLRDGQAMADAAVIKALYQKAVGCITTELVIIQNPTTGQPSTIRTTRQHPPDTNAAIFWLTNRQPEGWRR